ncbi:hypothetical protein [Sphingomonas sp. PB4P5]|uniref:hypothetical protein n=1 Tax=Parasphingomonas puruogangriensis TaxID=3096155 RepID=UPI002FC7C387
MVSQTTRPLASGISPPASLKLLDEVLLPSPNLHSVYRNLRGEGQSRTTFASLADVRVLADIENAITDQISRSENIGVGNIGLEFRTDAATESGSSTGRLDTKALSKHFAKLKILRPHSISRIVVACALASADEDAFAIWPVLVTLVLPRHDANHRPGSAQGPIGRSSAQPLGPRPELRPTWTEASRPEDVATMVRQFMDAPAIVRRACADLAKNMKHPTWRSSVAARHLCQFQLEALLPAGRAFFGAGDGDVILRIAVTKPASRARAAKKAENSVNRDDLVDLFWTDAHAHGRTKPPFVII